MQLIQSQHTGAENNDKEEESQGFFYQPVLPISLYI